MKNTYRTIAVIFAGLLIPSAHAEKKGDKDKDTVASQHADIGNAREVKSPHTPHPDAQWFPGAGLGLFLHWGISSVKGMNISHPMVVGRPLERHKIGSKEELARIVREKDYYLNGKRPEITPRNYFKMAESFNPDNYHPEKWLAEVKAAGFKYVVLTAKHHEGFAMWPSEFGDFNTKNFMGEKDLIRDFTDACHKLDIKVGLYYSGPDWYFDREFRSFLRGRAHILNPGLPHLDQDLMPSKPNHTKAGKEKHYAEFVKIVNGQVEELLGNYGKIDVIWFDGKPSVPTEYRKQLITKKRIRELQPGIVINPRMHGSADYITFERHFPENPNLPEEQWAEFCNPWNGAWPYVKRPYKPLNDILFDLVRCRAAGMNYLLGFGPMGNGDLAPEAYENMAKLQKWMDLNKEAIYGTRQLPGVEKASVPGARKGSLRYLYLDPENTGAAVTLSGISNPKSVVLLADGKKVPFTWKEETASIKVPAGRRGGQWDVLEITL